MSGDQHKKSMGLRAYEAITGAFAVAAGDTTTSVSVTGTAAEATGLQPNAVYRLIATQDCHVRFAESGDADTGDMRLVADFPEYFLLQDLTRISAIRASADGTLLITKMGLLRA